MRHHSFMAASIATGLAMDAGLERRVVEEGKRLLAAAHGEAEGARPVDRWLERLLERVMEDRVRLSRAYDLRHRKQRTSLRVPV